MQRRRKLRLQKLVANPAENLYGWKKEEAIGRISHELLHTQFPQPLDEIDSELVRNGQWKGKLVHTTRQGGRVIVDSRWILDPAGQPAAVVEINARSSIDPIDPDAHTDSHKLEIARHEPPPTGHRLVKFANIVLLGAAFFCLLLLSSVVYRYSWTAASQLVDWRALALYYGVPGILSMFFFASLRLSPMYRLNLAHSLSLAWRLRCMGWKLSFTSNGSQARIESADLGAGRSVPRTEGQSGRIFQTIWRRFRSLEIASK